jgi:hypothetical protein
VYYDLQRGAGALARFLGRPQGRQVSGEKSGPHRDESKKEEGENEWLPDPHGRPPRATLMVLEEIGQCNDATAGHDCVHDTVVQGRRESMFSNHAR